jgi:hypothetical protein
MTRSLPTLDRRDAVHSLTDDQGTQAGGLGIRRLWPAILTAIPIGTFLILGLFTGPSADDYCMADATIQHGYWGGLWNFYRIMSGRYASMGIEMLPGYLGHSTFLSWYWLAPTIVILSTLASTYVLLDTVNTFLLDASLRRSHVVGVAVTYTSMYLVGLEQPSQVLYWLTGSVNYQLANVLFVLLLAAMIRCYLSASTAASVAYFITSLALVVLAVGHNETTMVLTLGVLSLAALFAFLQGSRDRTQARAAMMVGLLVVGIVAALVVALAPGNAVRARYEEQVWGSHKADSLMELVQAGVSTVVWATSSTLRWTATQPSYWLAVFLSLAASRRLPPAIQRRLEHRSLLWLPAIGFVLIAATALPSFYVGRAPAARTTASIYLVFWLSFVVSGVVLMRRYSWDLRGSGTANVLRVALVVSILFHPKHTQAIEDFRDAALYRLQLRERDQMVTEAIQENRLNIALPKLMRLPPTIHFRDLSDDKSYYYNECFASYTGLQSVVADGETDTVRIARSFKDRVRLQIKRLVPWAR